MISCKQEEAQQALGRIQGFAKANGLRLQTQRTRIVDAREPGGFDFLGYHFERGMRWPRRKSNSRKRGKVFLDTLDAIQEFKREAPRESINEGRGAREGTRVRLGRPMKVNAYRDDVARLRARGLTGRAIAKELGIPSSSVFKLIKGARVSARRGKNR